MGRQKISQIRRKDTVRSSEYVAGNTVRKAETALPRGGEEKEVSQQVIRNRERVRHMDMRYVAFLAVCAVMTVFICVQYLKLHAEYTYLQKRSTSLSVELKNLQMENDTVYNEIVSGVDLEKVKERAMNDLGMAYPSEKQIITYQSPDSDYVKQYEEIPSK